MCIRDSAVMMRADEDGLTAAPVSDFRALPGNGLTATLSGEALLGGSLSFVSSQVDVPRSCLLYTSRCV